MSTPPEVRAAVLEALRKVSEGGDADDLTERLRRALLDFGSETPDNRTMADGLRIGQGQQDGTPAFGPTLGQSDVLVAEFAWAVEDLPMPLHLKQRFPELSNADWDTYTRFCTLVMSALTRRGSDL